jgi:hypothetical protein
MTKFKPFENESQSITVGNGNGITFENGSDEIVIYGDTTIKANSDPAVIDSLLEILTAIKDNLHKKDKTD